MKYVVLILIPLTLFAATPEREDKRRASQAITQLNNARAKQVVLCAKLNVQKDKDSCNAEFDDFCSKLTKDTMQGYIKDYLKAGDEKVDAEIVEEKCVAIEQEKLTERSQTFDGSETCKQLKYAVCVYDYTKLLVDAEQTPVATTCAGLRNEWAAYQEVNP